ncbi:MAG: hypothetical protein BJBARM5_0535 [Candidatus Parvarchaeum acidophilus ARMAN-5]|jgi:hypothetical protein|uniref:Uncharacterized protein n=1 Tax=Candidatus Parvarchaeum acidophilus ARMAN-5 TaxID=662762 RepID=D6GVM2_PARA5|nr:MAG: hypothetical protein BJBARM5_0535 [Candidatus Parvarchaeum acidophilus ARMAN-5]
MGKLENLEEELGAENSLNERVKLAFESIPSEVWMPLKGEPKTFNVNVVKKNSLDTKLVIRYEIVDNLPQQYKLENSDVKYKLYKEVYQRFFEVDGEYIMFLARKTKDSYQNVARINYYKKSVSFDRNIVKSISSEQLRRFAYATNMCLSTSIT